MKALITGELIKSATTRTVFVFAMVGVALAVGNVLILTLSEDLVAVADKREALAGLPVMVLLLGLVGAAGEYRHRTAAPAVLAAGHSRPAVLLARVHAYAVTGLVLGALTTATSLALGLPLLAREPGPGVGSAGIASVAAGSIISAGLCAALGVAAGALVRNQVVAVVGALTLMFVVAPLLALVGESVLEYTPFGAAVVLAGDPTAGSLSGGGAALILVAWAVALALIAILAERRRDLA
jgi:hypothetical protein